jgi:hypothetical protein
VIDEDRDGPKGIFSVQDDDLYEFCHNFLPDVLNQRVLESQRDELQNHVNEARLKREEKDRLDFMSSKGNKLAQLKLKEGYLLVHKSQVNNNRKPWKQRWAVIVGHRIEFYYDRSMKICSASSDLHNAKIFNEKAELSGRKRVIRISVPNWEKRGKPINEKRDFFISPELATDQERDQWIYFLNMAVETNQFENGAARKRGTSITGWFKAKPSNIKKPAIFTSTLPTPMAADFQSNLEPSLIPRKSRGLENLNPFGKKKASGSNVNDIQPLIIAPYQEVGEAKNEG